MANTTIPSELIADGSVVTAKIANDAVDADKLASNAVVTASIADDAVTLAKMAANSVDSDQYVDGSIDTIHIADGAITSAKLDTNIAVGGTLNVSGAFTSLGIDDNADATAITIDSSENVLVGTSSSNYAVVGSQLGVGGNNYMTRSGANPLLLNRLSSDGDILSLMKDGTSVGSIGTNAETMYVSAPQAGGMKYSFLTSTNAVMLPVTTTGANADATHDLGYDSARFRNLYLSGGVVFDAVAGNATSNTLDDYEEGTWTPTVAGGTAGYQIRTGRYTKIGNLVRLRCALKLNSWSGTGNVTITGIPFTCVAAAYDHDWSVAYFPYKPNANTWVCGLDTSSVFFRQQNATNADTELAHTDIDADTAILFTVVYQTSQ